MSHHQLLPSKARQVIVQQKPSLRVSFVMPAAKQLVRRYEGTGRGDGSSYKKETLDIPPILYLWEPVNFKLTMKIVEIEGGKIFCKQVRLANVHSSDGVICWGGESILSRDTPKKAVLAYWESTFNDDLTPYRYGSINQTVYEREERRDVVVDPWLLNIRESAILPSIAHPTRKAERQFVAADGASRNAISRITSMLGTDVKENMRIPRSGLAYQAWRRSSSGDTTSNGYKSLMSRCMALGRTKAAWEKWAIDRSERLDKIRRLERTFKDEGVQAIRRYIACLGCSDEINLWLDNSYTVHEIREHSLEADEWVDFWVSFHLRRQVEEKINDLFANGFTAWELVKKREKRQAWWDGEWIDYGSRSDFTNIVIGEERQVYEDGCLGIFYCDRFGSDYFSRNLPFEAWTYNSGYIGVTFATQEKGTILGLVAGLPFIGKVSKSTGVVQWEPYDDTTKAMLNEIEQIFG